MKKSLMVVALAATTAIAGAQTTVNFTKVLDTATSGTGSVYASTYVPGDHKFIVSRDGATIQIHNADTGAYETDMSLAGSTPTGLGFFALTATENSVIYGAEAGGADMWRWAGTTDAAPDLVYETVAGPQQRVGYTGTVGSEVVIAMTGAAVSNGSVEFFSDTFPFSSGSFVFNESVTLDAKSALAINNDGTVVFTAGDTGGVPIQKWVKTDGIWGATPEWSALSAGPMAYDNTNDILFVATSYPANNLKLYAVSGADGSTVGEATLENPLSNLSGYCGGFAVPSGTGGTVYLVGRGATATNAVMYVYDYEVESASVNDWSLYEQ